MYIGGKEKNKHSDKKLKAGRGAVGKQGVIGLRERGGHVKAFSINDSSRQTLQGAIHANVAPGSIIYTDEFRSYNGLDGLFYAHNTVLP